jgi:hypothetical protein
MVGPGGLEPLTSCVSSRRSNQLSYGPVASDYLKLLTELPALICTESALTEGHPRAPKVIEGNRNLLKILEVVENWVLDSTV